MAFDTQHLAAAAVRRPREVRMKQGRRVTREDVARAAGVSTAVVSYVVNNGPRPVSEEARERVLHAIQELGYRPNAAARALTMGSTGVYGLILPETRNPYFAHVAHFAVEAAGKRGVELLMLHEIGVVRSVVERLAQLQVGQIDGVLAASVFTSDEAATVKGLGYRVVLLNQFIDIPGFASYGIDLRQAARQGTEHLLEHGRRRLAFLGGANPADGRVRGWRDALAAAGLTAGPVLESRFSIRSAYEVARGAGTELADVDGLLVASDQQAWGVLRALLERGVRVPEQIAVVGLDGIEQGAYMYPPLTSIAEPTQQIIEDAFDELLAPEAPEPRRHIYPATLLRRRSCGC